MDDVRPITHILPDIFPDKPTVTIGEIADRMTNRGFGLLLIMLALPTLVPVLPPGSATVIGLLYVIVAVPMLAGAQRPWLPKRIRACAVSGETLVKFSQVA